MELKKTSPVCKYCTSTIHKDAKVCSVCGKYQSSFKENISHSISFIVLVIAFFQLVLATFERSKAEDAYNEAITARNEVVQAQKDIQITEKKLSEVGNAVVVISNILPRSTGYGAGLSNDDRVLLNRSIDVINKYSESLDVKLK